MDLTAQAGRITYSTQTLMSNRYYTVVVSCSAQHPSIADVNDINPCLLLGKQVLHCKWVAMLPSNTQIACVLQAYLVRKLGHKA